MPKTKILNFVDIYKLKKDLLWGKYYYALLDQGKLLDSILYSQAYGHDEVIEIHDIENKTKELTKDFVENFAKKRKIRYFLRELDEQSQVADIEFMNSCGFKRFSRNFCYEYDGSKHSPNEKTQINTYCRDAEHEDIPQLVEHDIDAQIIEYRDALFRPGNFFEKNLENVFVFCSSTKLEQMFAFCIRREGTQGETFEFVIHPKQATQIFDFVHAFAEKFIHFDKTAMSFRFIINESLNESFKDTAKDFNLVWTSQMLILEGIPREKSKQPHHTIVIQEQVQA